MKKSSVNPFALPTLLVIAALTSSVGMAQIHTTQETFVLSDEAPGNLITALINAGYGDYGPYDLLVTIQANTNPSVAGILTPAFINALAACPAGSQIFTTLIKNYPPGSSLAISTDGTVQITTVRASDYFNTAGTSTLLTDLVIVGNTYFVHAGTTPLIADFTTPMTTWDVTSGGVTTTYNVFAIASGSVTSSESVSVPTLGRWGLIVLVLLLGLSSRFLLRR